jgi:hypothetical protein
VNIDALNDYYGMNRQAFPANRGLFYTGWHFWTPKAWFDMDVAFSSAQRYYPAPGEQMTLSESRVVFGGVPSLISSRYYRFGLGANLGVSSMFLRYTNDSTRFRGSGSGVFANRLVTSYSNSAFVFGPKAELHLFPQKHVQISAMAGYQFGVSNGYWLFDQTLRVDPGPRTYHSSFYWNIKAGFGFHMRPYHQLGNKLEKW